MLTALRAFWTEPRPPAADTPSWPDRALVVVLLPSAALEAGLRAGLVWRPVAFALAAIAVLTLLFRRREPLACVLVALGLGLTVDLVALGFDVRFQELHTSACLLLLPYSLFRWGSGKEAAVGLAAFAAGFGGAALHGEMSGLDEAIGGGLALMFPAALGATFRFRDSAQRRALVEVKLQERGRLARELHDTVAHHVSAIAIQAQAGRAVASKNPEAALEALATIEAAASQSLRELREIVGALREEDDAELAPIGGLDDIARLAASPAEGLAIDVELRGDLSGLSPSTQAALFRLAQESVTNATRHAMNASRVQIEIDGDADAVHLSVTDDGDAVAPSGSRSGYGLVGMGERAALLGGTLEAKPQPSGGWSVTASLPRGGPKGGGAR